MIKLLIKSSILLFIITSCSSKFSLQKRKYNKGLYFSVSKKKKISDVEKSTLTKTKIKENEVKQPSIDTLKSTFVSLEATSNPTSCIALNNLTSNSKSKSPQLNYNESQSYKLVELNENKTTSKNYSVAKNSKKHIGQKNDVFQFFDNLYTGYLVLMFLILIGFAVWFIFISFPLIEAILIVGAGFLVICALVALGSLVNNGLDFF